MRIEFYQVEMRKRDEENAQTYVHRDTVYDDYEVGHAVVAGMHDMPIRLHHIKAEVTITPVTDEMIEANRVDGEETIKIPGISGAFSREIVKDEA